MSSYRFLGTLTNIGEQKLTKFGQPVELTDEMARDVIGTLDSGGGAILPEHDFRQIGFTEQELSLYSDPHSHHQANAAFHEKKARALKAVHELRVKNSPAPAPGNELLLTAGDE